MAAFYSTKDLVIMGGRVISTHSLKLRLPPQLAVLGGRMDFGDYTVIRSTEYEYTVRRAIDKTEVIAAKEQFQKLSMAIISAFEKHELKPLKTQLDELFLPYNMRLLFESATKDLEGDGVTIEVLPPPTKMIAVITKDKEKYMIDVDATAYKLEGTVFKRLCLNLRTRNDGTTKEQEAIGKLFHIVTSFFKGKDTPRITGTVFQDYG